MEANNQDKRCINHPDSQGVAFCKRCNGHLCRECIIVVEGKGYCKKCYLDAQKEKASSNKCINHPDKVGTAYCKKCGGYLCQACMIDKGDKKYCKKCYDIYQNVSSKPADHPIASRCVNHPDNQGIVFCNRCGGYLCQHCIITISDKRFCRKCYYDYQATQASQHAAQVQPKCINHPEIKAHVFCEKCKANLCAECLIIQNNRTYCKKCACPEADEKDRIQDTVGPDFSIRRLFAVDRTLFGIKFSSIYVMFLILLVVLVLVIVIKPFYRQVTKSTVENWIFASNTKAILAFYQKSNKNLDQQVLENYLTNRLLRSSTLYSYAIDNGNQVIIREFFADSLSDLEFIRLPEHLRSTILADFSSEKYNQRYRMLLCSIPKNLQDFYSAISTGQFEEAENILAVLNKQCEEPIDLDNHKVSELVLSAVARNELQKADGLISVLNELGKEPLTLDNYKFSQLAYQSIQQNYVLKAESIIKLFNKANTEPFAFDNKEVSRLVYSSVTDGDLGKAKAILALIDKYSNRPFPMDYRQIFRIYWKRLKSMNKELDLTEEEFRTVRNFRDTYIEDMTPAQRNSYLFQSLTTSGREKFERESELRNKKTDLVTKMREITSELNEFPKFFPGEYTSLDQRVRQFIKANDNFINSSESKEYLELLALGARMGGWDPITRIKLNNLQQKVLYETNRNIRDAFELYHYLQSY